MLVSPEMFEVLVMFSDWLRENDLEDCMLETSDGLVARFLDEVGDSERE